MRGRAKGRKERNVGVGGEQNKLVVNYRREGGKREGGDGGEIQSLAI